MQLYMKPLTFSTIILLTLSACGQAPNGSKGVSQTSSYSKDTTTIYKNISLETCDCTFSTMKNNKPSTSMDSCYKAVLLKYSDSLKQLGFDPATQVGQNKLSNEVVGKLYRNCPDLSRLIQKEYADENAKKFLFKGSIVSQNQLPSGEFEIILLDSKTKAKQTFKSKNPLYDPSSSDKNILSYETTIEYEIRHNSKTNKDEYYIKDGATSSGVSIQKVNVPK
jgi:hypothetical protein